MELPKGKLIAIGGNEDKGIARPGSTLKDHQDTFETGILKRILSEIGKDDLRLAVITTASSIPEEVGENYKQAFSRLGCKNVNVLHIKTREDTLNPEWLEEIKNVHGVLFTGGDQIRLSMIFGGTEFLEILYERYEKEEGFLIAGTSAGAMAMGNNMIYMADRYKVNITSGLGFIKNVILDTHFINRKRFARLARTVASNPSCFGIGLGEDTGVVITNGNMIETIGSDMIVIFDGHSIKHTNIDHVKDSTPLSIENLIVHVLSRGNCYCLQERKFFVQKV